MASVMDSVNQLTELVGQNRMELLLFRLSGLRQRYGINVFKVKEVLICPKLTVMPRLHQVVGIKALAGQAPWEHAGGRSGDAWERWDGQAHWVHGERQRGGALLI